MPTYWRARSMSLPKATTKMQRLRTECERTKKSIDYERSVRDKGNARRRLHFRRTGVTAQWRMKATGVTVSTPKRTDKPSGPKRAKCSNALPRRFVSDSAFTKLHINPLNVHQPLTKGRYTCGPMKSTTHALVNFVTDGWWSGVRTIGDGGM